MVKIVSFHPSYSETIARLITDIQQIEFQVNITLADQPDLLDISNFYFQGAGHFWCAVTAENQVIGTIALIDIGATNGVIRKMFVQQAYRGKEYGIADRLLQTLEDWAIAHGIFTLTLGTFDQLHAARRFYEKKDFRPVDVLDLPPNFPRMAVDNLFFTKKLMVAHS